jgi:hypothetical protein
MIVKMMVRRPPGIKWGRGFDPFGDMTVSRTHALAVYVAAQAAAVSMIALVPGLPDYGEGQQYLGGAVIIDLLLAYGLYKRSRFAWGASAVLAWFGLIIYSLAMLSDELQPKFIGVILLVAVQLALLHRELRPPPAASERLDAARVAAAKLVEIERAPGRSG